MAETQLTSPWGTFTLDLYPADRRSSLRAWDAADEYLLSRLKELQPSPEGTCLILNDSHGALLTALQSLDCRLWNDSSLSMEAVWQNLKQNKLRTDIEAPEIEHGEEKYSLVILKIPKTLNFLEYQLQYIARHVDENTLILAGGMVRHIHRSTLALFEKWIGETQTSLAQKKARLIESRFQKKESLPQLTEEPSYSVKWLDAALTNRPHVFSRNRLDRGTELLLESLHPLEEKARIADFGCGNGVIALCAASLTPDSQVEGVDDSLEAVLCARENAQRQNMQDRVKIFHGNRLTDLKGPFDAVYSNPPFHQGQSIDQGPTVQFFKDAFEMLKPSGELRIVCNRHLGYHKDLERIFSNCRTIREKDGYKVLMARKDNF